MSCHTSLLPSSLSAEIQEKKLESSETLRQAGIPEGEVHLRLEVSGGSGGSGGGSACASGLPISLKVRVEGGKTFTVGTTTASFEKLLIAVAMLVVF